MNLGIELELFIPFSYYDSFVDATLNKGWKNSRDGSLEPPNSYKGIEIKKRINLESLKSELNELLQILKAHKWKVNKTCGFHIHISYSRSIQNLKLLYAFSRKFIDYDYYHRPKLLHLEIFGSKHRQYMVRRLSNKYSYHNYFLIHHAFISISDYGTIEMRFFDPHLDEQYIDALYRYLRELDYATNKVRFVRDK
ncbi:MAG: hypothetical protein QW156_03780 [Candidatus Aenigmatarchaeota archaeon]